MNSEYQNGMRWASRSFPCQTTLGFYEIWYLRYQHSAVKSFTSSRTVYALKYINYEVDFTNICVLYYTALLHGYNRLKEQSGEKTSNNWNFWRTNLILKFWANSHQKSSFWGEHWEQEHLVPWYIWNQHLSLSTATAGATVTLWGQSPVPILQNVPALELGSALGTQPPVRLRPLWPHSCVCPSPLGREWGWRRREQKFLLLAWSWGSVWEIRLTHECWIICVWADFTAEPTHGPALGTSPCPGNTPEEELKVVSLLFGKLQLPCN